MIEEPQLDILKSVDLNEPPPRILSVTNRIIRDTVITRKIKELYNYQCQICLNDGLKLNDKTFYAEAHHIKPLGAPHNGPDTVQNILCVCPNCHVLLDYGAISIDESKIKVSKSHNVGVDYIEYHNENIYDKII